MADSLGLEGVENLTLALTGPPNIQLTAAILTVHILDTTGMYEECCAENSGFKDMLIDPVDFFGVCNSSLSQSD